MSDQDKEIPAEQAVEPKTENSKAIARFAQYTAPTMLAMLASGGHNAAAATGSPT
jgi:hypothetical protein